VKLRAAFGDLVPGTRVVVGCSGGADSLALLVLACEHRLDVDAVYVDHGLRTATEHDIDTVAAAAARFGAGFGVEAPEVGAGPNLEARARAARYSALENARRRCGADAILIGHTRDDQAETVLLQMLRGAALPGLVGMAPRRGAVVRPLLGVRRCETHELCARLGLAPVHDPMNDELQHRRVWLRREVIPRLEQGADRDLVEVLARQAEILRDDDAVLDELAAAHSPDDATELRALPVAVARRVVRRWLATPAPPSVATVERVLAVARGDVRAAELPGGDRVERVRGRLVRVPAFGRVDTGPPAPVELALPGRARFGDTDIEAWIEHAPPAAWPDGRSLVVCDADRLPDRVVVRCARHGERFRPLGRSGSKSVRDAQAEAGVAAGVRSSAPVVVGPEPVWVVGYRIDHRVRVTTGTRRYLWLSAEPAAT
jgi:tRNA(Ile)-lysidine synthase